MRSAPLADRRGDRVWGLEMLKCIVRILRSQQARNRGELLISNHEFGRPSAENYQIFRDVSPVPLFRTCWILRIRRLNGRIPSPHTWPPRLSANGASLLFKKFSPSRNKFEICEGYDWFVRSKTSLRSKQFETIIRERRE